MQYTLGKSLIRDIFCVHAHMRAHMYVRTLLFSLCTHISANNLCVPANSSKVTHASLRGMFQS
jgi:hypothetical protein